MSTAAELDPEITIKTPSPRPLASITASAQRITSQTLGDRLSRASNKNTEWQDDAWGMFDLVGEQRFLATTLAGRLAQARFYVGKVTTPGEVPERLDETEERISHIFEAVGDSDMTRSQMIYRIGVNLFLVGEGWFVGVPPSLLPESQRVTWDEDVNFEVDDAADLPLDSLRWFSLSISEVTMNASRKTVSVQFGEGEADTIECRPEQLYLIRIWRPHPRRSWEADSPTRSSLPVLRELVGLTMHISAQVDSRLAGAGVLLVPHTAQEAIRAQEGLDDGDNRDPFTENLIEAMITPINDRANASALVPLVVGVPDESIQHFTYLTFDKPLDAEAREMRDEAIRRLALGQDAPPELLLGVGSMNHWGAWLVREDVVSTHLEPSLALISDALTTQYLWPVLEALNVPREERQKYVIWYDVSHLIMRPNRSADAKDLYDKGVINEAALREASGFDDADAPVTANLDTARAAAFEMVQRSPGLLAEPGLDAIVEQLEALLSGGSAPALDESVDTQEAPEEADPDNSGGNLIPETDQDDMPEHDEMPSMSMIRATHRSTEGAR